MFGHCRISGEKSKYCWMNFTLVDSQLIKQDGKKTVPELQYKSVHSNLFQF